MEPASRASSRSLTRQRSFVLFWCARTSTTAAYQMLAVAVGWQIYGLSGSALDLGLVGLTQFFPVVMMALLIGQIADRYDRRAVARTCQIVKACAAAALAIGSACGWLGREVIFGILFVVGIARAFETPTMHALVPGIVPVLLLPRAIAASASANQTAIICGPAIGGFLYIFGPATVYFTCMAVFVLASVLVSLIEIQPQGSEKKPISFASLFAGFTYLRSRPVLLGAISLDLFAVLVGGVIALLPIFARDILQTGPWGLGLLRSAPAVGALMMSLLLARHAIGRHAGAILFGSVALFGLSIVVFALSTSLAVSLAALMVYGASDAISVVIRHSLVQTRTPDEMLGRVLAVNSMFTGTSSSLGEFESGLLAALLGPVASALIGGIGAIAVTLVCMGLFPDLRRVDGIVPERRPMQN
jgi:MFS family permease